MPVNPTARLPRVSIVIVTWNAIELLKEFLPTVVDTDYPDFEIIVADNASTDGSGEWVHTNLPGVRVVRHDENYAFCKGNNLALPHATGQYVVLLNNDVRVTPSWLRPLVERMESDSRVAAVQPKILSQLEPGRFEYAGAAGGFMDRWGYPFARGRIFDHVEADNGQYDQCCEVHWASGAAVMLRQSALDEAGFLDEAFYMHMEEIDLCLRLRRAGYKILCEPASVVHHVGAASLSESSPEKVYLNFRNNLLTLYKNLGPTSWRRVLSVRMAMDLLALVRELALLRPAVAEAILRGYRDALRMKRAYASERAAGNLVKELYRGSIVVDYFVKRRRRFSDLRLEARPCSSDAHDGGAASTEH